MVGLVIAALLIAAMLWKSSHPPTIVKKKDRYTQEIAAEVVQRSPIIRRHPSILLELAECRPFMDAGAFRKLCKRVASILRPKNRNVDPLTVSEQLATYGGLAAEGVVREVIKVLRARSTMVHEPLGTHPRAMWGSA